LEYKHVSLSVPAYPIRTENLSKIFGGRWFSSSTRFTALDDLSLEVPAGSVFGFLGPNGAGKTTTIKLLLGLLKASSGKAWLMDKQANSMQSRAQVGYMPELPALYEQMSGREFLHWMGRLARLSGSHLDARTEEVLHEVELDAKAGERIGHYSRGMKQRLELAQALLHEPQLVILDEPFSGLDPVGRRHMRDVISHYNRNKGMTVFFSSHILADVENLCDWAAILKNGKLRALGRTDELLQVRQIEVSASNVRPEGIMFIEKMGEYSQKNKDRYSIFLAAHADAQGVVMLFTKYGGTDIEVKRHCTSLEEFFIDTIQDGTTQTTGKSTCPTAT